MNGRLAAAVCALGLLAAPACVGEAGTTPDRPAVERPVGPFGEAAPPGVSPEDVVVTALADLDRAWAGIDEPPLPPLAALTPAAEADWPWCDGHVDERLATDNALYCAAEDEIVYDATWIADIIRAGGGPLGAAAVMAHEYGHVLQDRLGIDGPLLLLELQADCFAGAWLARVRAGEADGFVVAAERELSGAVRQLLLLRDSLDRTTAGMAEHGTGFDRVHSVLDGLDEGAARCLAYPDDPPRVTAQAWGSTGEQRRGGDAALPALLRSASADLDALFSVLAAAYEEPEWRPATVVLHRPGSPSLLDAIGDPARFTATDEPFPETCGDRPACALDGTVHLAMGELEQRHATGDMATGVTMGLAYAELAQQRAGRPPETSQAHCTIGLWLGSRFPSAERTEGFVLSPGDLDEAALVLLLDRADGVAAMRATLTGFDGGIDRCRPTGAPASG